MDEHRRTASGEASARLWEPLADLLERHAASEEKVFYPALLEAGTSSKDETEDAITDHNQIRDAVQRAGRAEAGSEQWWEAVDAARRANSDHMGEEERGALADLRSNTGRDDRRRLGEDWRAFSTRHAGMAGLESRDKDPDRYIAQHQR